MKVSIIMGSTSDYEVMNGAEQFLADFGIEYETRVISAHRTPDLMFEYTKALKGRGFGVVIAGAGGAAHLAGVAAGLTPLPVIAVPMQTKTLGGGGAKNAAILAAEIIALLDPEVAKKIDAYREAQAEKIRNTTLPPKQ